MAIARSENLSLNQYLTRLVRADVSRRQRLASATGLSRWATDAELADALGAAVAAPLSDIEQAHLPSDPTAAVAYTAGRAAKRAKTNTSKPAPSPGSAPPKQRKALQSWRSAPDTHRLVGAGTALQIRAAKSETASLPTEFLLFRKGENPSTKGSVVFDQRAADLVMAAYRRHGTRLMIDLEHQALFGLGGDAGDARGWADVELRSGSLYATNVEWTPDGARRLRERTQLYTSPAFLIEMGERDPLPRAIELINVAITALPATHGLAPLMRGAK